MDLTGGSVVGLALEGNRNERKSDDVTVISGTSLIPSTSSTWVRLMFNSVLVGQHAQCVVECLKYISAGCNKPVIDTASGRLHGIQQAPPNCPRAPPRVHSWAERAVSLAVNNPILILREGRSQTLFTWHLTESVSVENF